MEYATSESILKRDNHKLKTLVRCMSQQNSFMKFLITFLGLVLLSVPSFGQTEMELKCLNDIGAKSKYIVFPINSYPIVRKADSIHFDRSLILLRNSCEEAFLIFNKGLLFPELIIGASTSREGELGKTSHKYIGTISISSFRHIETPSSSPTKKTFTFLLWQTHLANPMLYILQLTNEMAGSSTTLSEFIEGSKVSAFGFCSMLV